MPIASPRPVASAALIISTSLLGAGAGHASTITWFAPSQPGNSQATWPSGTSYTNNFGVAFQTGSGSPSFVIDWIKIGLNTNTSTSGAGTIKLALNAATNSTPYSAVAAATQLTLDAISFTAPTATSTPFELDLGPAQLPSLVGYAMSPSTAYSLILYAPTGGNWAIRRQTGYANQTTNDNYITSNGFVALDTFRNNIANYSNSASSYPTLSIAFGSYADPATDVPGTLPLAGVAALFSSTRRLRKAIRSRALQ